MSLIYTSLINDANLTAYWRFDENSGTTLQDHIGSNNLTATDNSIVGKSGKFTGSVASTTSHYSYKTNPDTAIKIPGGDPFGISFWFKTTSSGTNVYFWVACGNNDTNDAGWWIRYVGNGTVVWYTAYNATGQNNGCILFTDTGIYDGNWHHLVVTTDALKGGGTVNCWLDNVNKYNNTHYGTSDVVYGSMTFYVGGKNAHIDCNFDDMAIFNRELNASDVSILYNSPLDKHPGILFNLI